MFSKFAASTLRLYLQRDNIGLLNENYNYKSKQNGGPEEDHGLCVWCEGLRLDRIGLLNLSEY